MDEKLKEIEELEGKEAVEQSMALVEIVKDLLDTTRQQLKRIYIILAISIIANLVIVGAFLWYESHMEVTETTTTTQTVDGESSINNTQVDGDQYQYKDNASHNDNRKTEKK